MKNNLLSAALLFLLVFLISTSYSTASKLAITTEKGEASLERNEISNKDSIPHMKDTYPADGLMEVEECPNKDEECLRRLVLEAHLDYIYTQHHKP